MNASNHPFEPTPSDRVAVRAHQLWENAGCPEGRDIEFWVAAEREVQQPAEGIADDAIEQIQSPYGISGPGREDPTDDLRDTPVTGGQTGQSSSTSL